MPKILTNYDKISVVVTSGYFIAISSWTIKMTIHSEKRIISPVFLPILPENSDQLCRSTDLKLCREAGFLMDFSPAILAMK